MTPGDADSALTIGAVDVNGIVADFSGYGPNAAGQVKPDVCAMGVATIIFNGGSAPFSPPAMALLFPPHKWPDGLPACGKQTHHLHQHKYGVLLFNAPALTAHLHHS